MNITDEIKNELLKRVELSKKKDSYDFWDNHIKYVVKNAKELAKEYNADVEIVELGALLHDISLPSGIGPRDEHHIYGAQIAEELLTSLNYPKERIERVKQCVLNHRGSKDLSRNTIEEECVADADVIAHFDAIPMLFSAAFQVFNLDLEGAKEYVKKKLEKDYNKLSERSKRLLHDRYVNVMQVLFGEYE